MKQLICFIVLCVSAQLNASQFLLFNEGSPVVLEQFTHKKSLYTLENFRIRVIAEHIYGSTKNYSREWLQAHQFDISKTFVPRALSESGYGEIFNGKKAVNKLTFLLTADGYSNNKSAKFLLCSKDVKLLSMLRYDDTIKISIESLYMHENTVKVDFKILIDNNDGNGFVELVQENGRYLSFDD